MSEPLPVQPPLARPRWKSWLSLDNRYVPPVFITLILVVGHLSFGILESYEQTLVAIIASIAVEIALGRMLYGKWPNLASAYITGISVGILVRSPRALAIRALQRDLDHVEIRAAGKGTSPLESIQLRHLGDAVHCR
jgi:hypothetical protein